VHVRLAGSTSARAAVALRDLLREDADARAAYAGDKRRLAALHPDDVDAYAEGKTPLLVPLLARALGRDGRL
jgi:dephospho-CoA kinase